VANPIIARKDAKNAKKSDRVSSFVRGKSDEETIAYYLLTKGEFLTNLGVLWIGRREDRAALPNAPVAQFLKFDETGEKVNKLVWDDFSQNPMDLIHCGATFSSISIPTGWRSTIQACCRWA
jgi:hypothetical protein